MKKLLVAFILVVMVIPSLAIADEIVIEVERTTCGTYFELVINHGEAYLRTHLQKFIDLNGGSVYKGRTAAKRNLMEILLRLVKVPDRVLKTEDGYSISFSGIVKGHSYVNHGYVIIELGAVRVDGKKIKIF